MPVLDVLGCICERTLLEANETPLERLHRLLFPSRGSRSPLSDHVRAKKPILVAVTLYQNESQDDPLSGRQT